MTDQNARNERLIAEFRANDGKVASLANAKLLVLHTTGRKSGAARESLMAYQQLGDSYAVFASAGGSPRHPAWFHNLIAEPHVQIEVGTQIISAIARVSEGEERQHIWDTQRQRTSFIDDYAAKSGLTIPVVVLDPVS